MRNARRAQRSAAVDGHRGNSVLEWNSYRVAGGVQCAHLKMAAIRRSDAPRVGRGRGRRVGARVCACPRRCAGGRRLPPSLAAAPALPSLHVPQHVRFGLPVCPTADRSRSRASPPAPRPADNARYQTTR